MLVALLALVLAMTGTATAAVLITSPDQLADRVVTSSKLDNEAVSAEKLATDSVNSRALNEPSVESTNLRAGFARMCARAPSPTVNSCPRSPLFQPKRRSAS